MKVSEECSHKCACFCVHVNKEELARLRTLYYCAE